MSKIIEVIITPQGETRIETKGFAGSSCQEASQFLERALGSVVLNKPTAEFYRTQESDRIHHQH